MMNGQPTERSLKIYLPDGHLAEGGKRIWEYTKMPYSMDNYRDDDIGKPSSYTNGNGMNGNGKRSLVIVIEANELKGAGYETRSMDRCYVIIRRPHNIAESLGRASIGITGKDFLIERLKLQSGLKGLEIDFLKELTEHDIVNALNLEYRPASIVLAFPKDHKIASICDIGNYYHQPTVRIATEYPWIAWSRLMECNGHIKFEVKETAGKSEGYIPAGDSEGIVDVCQTGTSVVENGLRIASPLMLDKTTPYMVFNRKTYEMFPEFCDELRQRVEHGRDVLKMQDPEMFEQRINQDAFWPPRYQTREERALDSLAAG